jgi:hypothetical protein
MDLPEPRTTLLVRLLLLHRFELAQLPSASDDLILQLEVITRVAYLEMFTTCLAHPVQPTDGHPGHKANRDKPNIAHDWLLGYRIRLGLAMIATSDLE